MEWENILEKNPLHLPLKKFGLTYPNSARRDNQKI